MKNEAADTKRAETEAAWQARTEAVLTHGAWSTEAREADAKFNRLAVVLLADAKAVPACYCSSLSTGRCDFCTGLR